MTANVAVFSIDWSDLQLNVPNPFVPGQFYIANVGVRAQQRRRGRGERPRARRASMSSRARLHARAVRRRQLLERRGRVAATTIPNTPAYTAIARHGAVARRCAPACASTGAPRRSSTAQFWYDEANTRGQDAYSLANFRGGVRGQALFVEGWIRNAFDTHYIPVAFAYGPFAPSGFIGESGRPRTFGLRAGVSF